MRSVNIIKTKPVINFNFGLSTLNSVKSIMMTLADFKEFLS